LPDPSGRIPGNELSIEEIEKLLLAAVILTVAALPITIVTSERPNDSNSQPVATAQLVRLAATQASR